MKKVDPSNNTDKLMNQLSNDVIRHTCQFFSRSDSGEMRPLGSGVCVLIHGHPLIFTAEHVITDLSEENPLYIQHGKTEFSPVNQDVVIVEGIDLAYIKISRELFSSLNRAFIFLPLSEIEENINRLNGIHYCVVGYPEVNVKKKDGIQETGGNAYFTSPANDNVFEYYDYEKEDYHVLNMKGKGINVKTGQKHKTNTHFWGISGCGLWFMIFSEENGKYTVGYKLIGIMTEFRNSRYFCLVGVRVGILIDRIIEMENIEINRIEVRNVNGLPSDIRFE